MFDKYRLKKGETLNQVAKKYNTSITYLQDINKLYCFDEARADMEIIVPKNTQAYFELYTIEQGDSLYGISRRYNINPNLLASLNGLNLEDYIYPGQEILIPKSNYSYYLTAEGDTLNSVAEMFQVNKNKLLEENETIYILGDQLLVHKKN